MDAEQREAYIRTNDATPSLQGIRKATVSGRSFVELRSGDKVPITRSDIRETSTGKSGGDEQSISTLSRLYYHVLNRRRSILAPIQ